MSSKVNVLDLLTLLQLAGVGPRTAVRMAEDGLADAHVRDDWPRARAEAEAIVEECERLGIEAVGWFDPLFPSRLRAIPDAPAVLFFRGAIAAADADRSAAVVGTREPSGWGRAAASTAARVLAQEGWTIVSGLALGVDTVAHHEALAAGVPTVAVLGNGLGSVYPAANRRLAEQIVAEGGLLLAEVPPGSKVEPRSLVKRDRLQSGLAQFTVVCQGGRTSGAMHTARYAVEQGRPLYVAAFERGDPLGPHDEGTHALLKEPSLRLPQLLPAWQRVSARLLNDMPAAGPLDEESLAELAKGLPREHEPSTLF